MRILERLHLFTGLPRQAIESNNQHFVEVGYQPDDRIYTADGPTEWL